MVLLVLAGIVLGAAYMLGMFQRLVLGPVSPQSATLHDLNRREIACVIPLALAVFVIGLYPTLVVEDATVETGERAVLVGEVVHVRLADPAVSA